MELTLWLIPITLLFLHFLSTFTKKKLKILPPGPTPLPIVGNLFSMVDLPHIIFAKLAKTYGPVISLKMGANTFIVLSSPDLAREAFQTKDKSLSERWCPDFVHAYGHKEISMMFLSSSNPLWKQLRAVGATYLFSPRSLDLSRAVREAKARELVGYFRDHAGEPLRVNYAVFSSMINVVSGVLFSENMVDLNSDVQEFRDVLVASIVDPAKPNISYLFPFLRPLDLNGARRYGEKLFDRYYGFFNDIINRRLNGVTVHDEKHKDFLDSLLELHAENKIDLKVIRAYFMDIFGAGAHTSSVVLEWAMAELLHNPDKMSKVISELRENIGSKQVEETDITKLPYLQAVVKETMRKHPVAPLLLPHIVSEKGVELGGYAIPKGAQVMVNVYAIGRDPTVWSEPEIFRPERFLESKLDFRGHDFELIPFGSGRRTCAGLPLVTRMLPLFLATLLQAFEWRLPDGMKASDMDMSEKFEGAVALASPLTAIPVPISGLEY
ncbi:hypothetical protein LUZ61_008415 [Rhynchospora tenuis]|uniref:Cytochrome P450 n=1 Tax=Rhynchospora tenuis TaxID=198213 RepID=A0AAD6EXL0_9POAL|nr:hypothetical protein LUZ61_008415 [Rhynchospora tenuis]